MVESYKENEDGHKKAQPHPQASATPAAPAAPAAPWVSWEFGVALLLFGVPMWIAGARFTFDGARIGLNYLLARMTIPAQIPALDWRVMIAVILLIGWVCSRVEVHAFPIRRARGRLLFSGGDGYRGMDADERNRPCHHRDQRGEPTRRCVAAHPMGGADGARTGGLVDLAHVRAGVDDSRWMAHRARSQEVEERRNVAMEKFTPELLGVTVLSLVITFMDGTVWVAREPIIAWMVKLFHRYVTVNRSSSDYVTHGDNDGTPHRNFPASHREVEAEVARKRQPGSDDGMIVITQNALQNQIDDATQDGIIRAFAVFQSRGYIPAGKATEIKKALFEVSGGRRLQALNAAIDAVMVPAASPAPCNTDGGSPGGLRATLCRRDGRG
jgi:hypothetical protein